MTITFKNGELKYCVKDIDLCARINIDLSTKKSEPYLFMLEMNILKQKLYIFVKFLIKFLFFFFLFIFF